jgi:hypothetical protein
LQRWKSDIGQTKKADCVSAFFMRGIIRQGAASQAVFLQGGFFNAALRRGTMTT